MTSRTGCSCWSRSGRPNPDAADRLIERAQGGESVKAAGGALWFHFPQGVGTSKLTPSLIDKACGSPSTGTQLPDRAEAWGDARHMTAAPLIPRKYWLIAFALVALMAAILLWMGRGPICTCGTVKLWVGTVHGPDNSQHLADWYTPSHIIHGFLFYLLGWVFLRRNPPGDRLIGAVVIEAAWEILENSPIIIDRYREATMAMGYTGDSVINSAADVFWMIVGFGIARRLPVLGDGGDRPCIRSAYPLCHSRQSDSERADAGLAGGWDKGLAGRNLMRLPIAAALLAVAAPAQASEVFGGLLAHDVDSPLTKGGLEDGADIQLGWRGNRMGTLGLIGAPSPYVFASAATGGGTHFAAAGLSWRIGGRLFVRPGLGLAVHTRSRDGVASGLRTDLGSRILFEPELGVGVQVSRRLSVEATWVHVSHAQLLSRQNPGMDSFGIRLSWRLR